MIDQGKSIVQIEPFKPGEVVSFFWGMKQKPGTLLCPDSQASVLFLDEPTRVWFTVSRRNFLDMLKRLKSTGITILSTPYYGWGLTLCWANLLDPRRNHVHLIRQRSPLSSVIRKPLFRSEIQSKNECFAARRFTEARSGQKFLALLLGVQSPQHSKKIHR